MLREQAALLDLTHDTVFVRDEQDVITYWNRGAEELYGWTRAEAIGSVAHVRMRTVFPAPFPEIMAELTRTGRWEGELVHTRRDGTPVVVASRWSLRRGAPGRVPAVLETNNDTIVAEVLPLVRPELRRHGIALRMTLAENLPAVLGDRIQLQQVLINLLVNAAEAMRDVPAERRRLVVAGARETIEDDDWAGITVEDGGAGLGDLEAERLFEPFYSTKPGGLGMGLSISRSIVESHGGRLWATANPDHGATFHLALPGLSSPPSGPSTVQA
jgi:PAS domain S-box-containing protein